MWLLVALLFFQSLIISTTFSTVACLFLWKSADLWPCNSGSYIRAKRGISKWNFHGGDETHIPPTEF